MTEKIKTLKIIHMAMFLGTALMYFLLGKITSELLKIPQLDSSSIPFLLIPIIAYFLSNFLFKSQLKQINPKDKLESKLPIYQSASIIRWAILEGAAFIIVIASPNLILFGIPILLYFVSLRPTEERIRTELT